MMRLNDAHCHFFSRRFFETLARDDRQGRFADSPVEDICATLEWEAPGSPSELAATWISALDHHGCESEHQRQHRNIAGLHERPRRFDHRFAEGRERDNLRSSEEQHGNCCRAQQRGRRPRLHRRDEQNEDKKYEERTTGAGSEQRHSRGEEHIYQVNDGSGPEHNVGCNAAKDHDHGGERDVRGDERVQDNALRPDQSGVMEYCDNCDNGEEDAGDRDYAFDAQYRLDTRGFRRSPCGAG